MINVLIEVLAGKYSFVIYVDKYVDEFRKHLPFRSRAHVWKEEVYFETPITIGDKANVYSIELGEVYYWPPGKALCLFYGLSEPYTPVLHIGYLVGPLHYLREVSEGTELEVREHSIDSRFSKYVEVLKRLGYYVATPIIDGATTVVASKGLGFNRIAFTLYIEKYGIHIESEPFFRYEQNLSTVKLLRTLKNSVKALSRYTRIDLDEMGNVCITAIAEDIDQLNTVVREFERIYSFVCSILS